MKDEVKGVEAKLEEALKELDWARRKLAAEIGPAVGEPISGEDTCGECHAVLDEDWSRGEDDRWICSARADLHDAEYEAMEKADELAKMRLGRGPKAQPTSN